MYSKFMLMLDGPEPLVLSGIGWSRYYTNLYTDYQALRHLIYLESVLSIQAVDNSYVLEEKLKGMLSAKMYMQFSYEKEQERKIEEQKKDENLIENLCKGERLCRVKCTVGFENG